MPRLTYEDKENVNPVVDRKKQATKEDFDEIKASVNAIYDGELIDDAAERPDKSYSSDKVEALNTALTKYWGAEFRARLDPATSFLHFEREDSPGVWVEKFSVADSIIIPDNIKFEESTKPTPGAGVLGLYAKQVTIPGIGETTVLTAVDPNQDEYVLVVYDITADRVIYITHDGVVHEVPKKEDLDLLFNAAVRSGEDLILTQVNGTTVTIPLGIDTPTIEDFSMSIPTRVNVGTDLNILADVYYTVTDSQDITALTLVISEGQISEIAIPQQDGPISTVALPSGVDTSTPKDVTLQITGGTATPGMTFQSKPYVIQVVDPVSAKDIYYGGSAEEAASVDLSQFTKVPYTTSGQTESFTLLVQANEYYYIFVPHDPGLNKIYNTTLGEVDVTAEFSVPPDGQKLESVQTIGNVAYDSYRRGPDPTGGEQDLKVVMS